MSAIAFCQFAERCDGAASQNEVEALWLSEMQSLGFSFAACASHVDPLRPPPDAVMMVRYPQPWLEHFSQSDYAARDPIFRAARRSALPFRWRDAGFQTRLTQDERRILNEAAEFGLVDGLTIPLHAPGARAASCSLVSDTGEIASELIPRAHWCAVYAHATALRLVARKPSPAFPALSPRERQCIALAARGKDDYAIGVTLGIRQSTAHNIIQRAKAKYGVATRAQAIVRALVEGEITLDAIAD